MQDEQSLYEFQLLCLSAYHVPGSYDWFFPLIYTNGSAYYELLP